MGKWLTRLAAIEHNSVANSNRGEWEILLDLKFQSDVAYKYWVDNGKTAKEALNLAFLVAPAGFHTDFMSVPPEVPDCARLARSRRAGALHDFLYTKPHFIEDRETCDKILKEMFIADVEEDSGDDMPTFEKLALYAEADLVYEGVRLGGGSHWD